MKRIGIAASVIGILALTLWTVSMALEVEQKIYFMRQRHTQTSGTFLTLTGSGNVAASKSDDSTNAVPAPEGHPPLQIVIGARLFNVVYVSHEWMVKGGRLASSDFDKRRILLDRQRSPVEVREDMLHELMHMALIEAGGKWNYSNIPEDESFIKPMAPELRDILIDNPALLKWLVKAGG